MSTTTAGLTSRSSATVCSASRPGCHSTSSASCSTWRSTTTRWTRPRDCWPRRAGRCRSPGPRRPSRVFGSSPSGRRAAGTALRPFWCNAPRTSETITSPGMGRYTAPRPRATPRAVVTRKASVVTEFRSGFASIIGRPNAGKSTLTNALVGTKVAITSGRPQTTRHVIRGIVHRPDAQLVLVDTPGLHRPRTLLGQRLNDLVRDTLTEVDVVVFCLPADQKVGPGDRYIANQLAELGRGSSASPVVATATKADLVSKQRLAEHLLAVSALGDWADIVPVSATDGYQIDVFTDVVIGLLPPGPALYPDGELTDEPELIMIAELIREAALEGVRDELPHSLAVVVDEIVPREGPERAEPMLDVRVSLFVERESQKAIVIGKGGSRLKYVGTTARQGIEALLGARVFLDLRVKVAKDWPVSYTHLTLPT